MKIAVILGLILIVLGVAGLIFPEIHYNSERALFEIGSFKASMDKDRVLEIPTFASGGAIALGALIIIVTFLKKK